MKSTILVIFALFFMLPAATACSDEGHSAKSEASGLPIEIVRIKANDGTEHTFHAEIAAEPQALMRGLMFRESMPANHGMIFMFQREEERNFWMKNTLIPLDIVFIKADWTINHIHKNAVPMDETRLPSNGPVTMVLEINGGMSDKLGIKPGDKVLFGPSPDKQPDAEDVPVQ